VKIDPQTTVAKLLAAIPSSELVLLRLGITADSGTHRTLLQACSEQGITFEQFLEAMDAIDWSGEAPSMPGSD
jgi:hypothetical protein